MVWLYRLQQRLSITRHEGLAILTLTLLFVTGLTVRHVQEQQVPPLAVDSLTAQPAATTAGASSVSPAEPASTGPTKEDPLHLNEASAEALQALNGIGPALSERIIDYRSTQRPFQRVEELRRVSGIGPKTLADVRSVVTVVPAESE
jgi:competence protein ComEA